jgi:hypothetical protein
VRKIYSKIFLTVMTLIVSVSIIAVASYAWMTLSTSPSATGMTISIGGGQTILLAEDKNGSPGEFGSTLSFDGALGSFSLSPVSTADGVHWIVPEYDDYTGELLETKEFTDDKTLEYANKESTGRYVYVDFWVVSPGKDYNLRVSTDKNTYSGSYLIELPSAVKDGEGFSLDTSASALSASARVGFLVNDIEYTGSGDYATLKGKYSEAGDIAYGATTFTIYEPNGTLHLDEKNGSYIVTKPVGVADDGTMSDVEIDPARLTVQTATTWNEAAISMEFKTGMMNKSFSNAQDAQSWFYNERIKGQISSYLSTGLFFQDTEALYKSVSGENEVTEVTTAGATDGTIIANLWKNVPQKIRMFFWLEGQDVDCTSGSGYVDASNIVLSIELAGSEK